MKVSSTLPLYRFQEKYCSAGHLRSPIAIVAATTDGAIPTFHRSLSAAPGRAARGQNICGCWQAGPHSNQVSGDNATLSTRATSAISRPVVVNCNQTRQSILKNPCPGYLHQSIQKQRGEESGREGSASDNLCVGRHAGFAHRRNDAFPLINPLLDLAPAASH